MTSYQSIAIDQIIIDESSRPVDLNHVEALAKMIEARGLQQPVRVDEFEGKYRLVFGRHRLEAVKSLGRISIDAQVGNFHEEKTANDRAIDRVMENLGRGELNALERAEHLSELKAAYEVVYPEAEKKGGKRGNQHTGGIESQSEIFSFSQDAAQKLQVSQRLIQISVAICKGLPPEIRARIHGTDLAKHQAGLKLLSEQKSALQKKILDIIDCTDNSDNTVADALIRAKGEVKKPQHEKRMATVQDYMGRMDKKERTGIFQAFEDEVREFAELKGWF